MKKTVTSFPKWPVRLLMVFAMIWMIAGCEKEDSTEGFIVNDYPQGLYAESLDLDNDGNNELIFQDYARFQYYYLIYGGESLGLWNCYLSWSDSLANVGNVTQWYHRISFTLGDVVDQYRYVAIKKVVGANTYYGWMRVKLTDPNCRERIYKTVMCTIPNQPISVGQTSFHGSVPASHFNPDRVSDATSLEDFLGTYSLTVYDRVGTLTIAPAGDDPSLVSIIGSAPLFSTFDTLYNTTAAFDPATHCLIPQSHYSYIYNGYGEIQTCGKVSYGPIFHQGDSVTFDTKLFIPGSQGNDQTLYYHNNAQRTSSGR